MLGGNSAQVGQEAYIADAEDKVLVGDDELPPHAQSHTALLLVCHGGLALGAPYEAHTRAQGLVGHEMVEVYEVASSQSYAGNCSAQVTRWSFNPMN